MMMTLIADDNDIDDIDDQFFYKVISDCDYNVVDDDNNNGCVRIYLTFLC